MHVVFRLPRKILFHSEPSSLPVKLETIQNIFSATIKCRAQCYGLLNSDFKGHLRSYDAILKIHVLVFSLHIILHGFFVRFPIVVKGYVPIYYVVVVCLSHYTQKCLYGDFLKACARYMTEILPVRC